MELSEEIRRNPYIRLVIPFIIGIVFSLFFYVPVKISLPLFLLSILVFIVIASRNKFSLNFAVGIAINAALFIFGLFITQYTVDNSKRLNLSEAKGFIIGEIPEDIKRNEKSIRINVDILAIKNNDEWLASSGKTLLYLERDSLAEMLKPGDKIIFSPNLSEIKNKGNPEEFDYKKYLSRNLIYSSDYLTNNDWQLVDSEHDIKLRHKLLRFRTKLVYRLKELGLDDDELAVVSALALGYKDNLSNEIRHSYSSSGAMHILAVSGLHVGIVYGVLLFILSFLRTKKLQILKVVIIVGFIWMYAMLTGLSPSVTRAATMFTIAAIGKLKKHQGSSLNSVAASAFLLLLINPLNIVDIGFQLSYLAVVGIIVMQPRVYNIFTVRNKLLDKIWSLTTVSVVAQIATGPLAIYYFHQFSNYFLLANYILIPISTIAIWLCILVFVFSGVGFIISFLTKILAFVMQFMNGATIFIESLPYSVTENIYINLPQLLAIYIAIIMLFVFFFYSRKYLHLVISVVSLIAFSTISLYREIQIAEQKSIIVYNINKATAINIIDGKNNIIFANLSQVPQEQIVFTAKNNWLKKGVHDGKYVNISSGGDVENANITDGNIFFRDNYIGFDDVRMFVLDNKFAVPKKISDKIKLDYLILSSNPKVELEDLKEWFDFEKIIIACSNSNYLVQKWLKQNEDCQYPLHNIKSDGAFVLEK